MGGLKKIKLCENHRVLRNLFFESAIFSYCKMDVVHKQLLNIT